MAWVLAEVVVGVAEAVPGGGLPLAVVELLLQSEGAHGGNAQVITAPDGWPLWPSPVGPVHEHDTTAPRPQAGILPAWTIWAAEDRPGLATWVTKATPRSPRSRSRY